MSKSIDKRAKHDNQDRLSDLPDCVLLHILSSLNSKQVVQTCILSTRWKHIWKRIPILILHSSEFSGLKSFATFVSQILTLRDSSIALHTLDLQCRGTIDTELLGMILNYICSHNAHIQQLRICVTADSRPILSCISKCRALTSLKLSIYPRDSDSGRALTSLKPSICPRDSDSDDYKETLFPKSLNLPLLTSLDLENFTFCGGESGCAEPFSAFTKLNSLVIRCCKVKDAQILNVSSETLVNLTMEGYLYNLPQIKLSTPTLCIFTFTGIPVQKICGSGLSSVKQVNIDAQDFGSSVDYGLVLLSWLQDLVSVESLSVSSTTVQILSLVPNLLKVKIPSLCNLKTLEVQWMPLNYGSLYPYMETAMLKKAASKSRKEAAMLN